MDAGAGIGAGAGGNINTELATAPMEGVNDSVEAGLNIGLRITGHGGSSILLSSSARTN